MQCHCQSISQQVAHKKTTSSWWMTLMESCHHSGQHIAKQEETQSISIKKNVYHHNGSYPLATCYSFSSHSDPFFPQLTDVGSINWQASQALTTDLTSSLGIIGSMILAKYSILLTPGWPLFWWMSDTWLLLNWLVTVVQLSGIGSLPFLCRSSHLCGALVKLLARFWQDFSVMSIVSTYSSTKARSIPRCRLTNISPATFVFTRTFPVRASDTHQSMHADSFNHCIKFGQIDVPSIINWTQPTSIFYNASIYNQCHSCSHETCTTQTFISSPFTYQSLLTGSDSHTLAIVFASIQQKKASLISPSHFLAHLLGA